MEQSRIFSVASSLQTYGYWFAFAVHRECYGSVKTLWYLWIAGRYLSHRDGWYEENEPYR